MLFASGNRPVSFVGENTFNLIALKKGQSVFIRIPTDLNTGVILRKNFKILCPQGYTLNVLRECSAIHRGYICFYINVQCEKCPDKTYTLERGQLVFNESNGIKCQQCPRGGACDTGLITAKSNFWGYKTNKEVVFVQCPPGYCCNNDDCLTYDSCQSNRSGALCGQCPKGMSESLFTTQCISTDNCYADNFFILSVVLLFVLHLIFFLYHNEIVSFLRTRLFDKRLSLSSNSSTCGNTASPSGMIKIVFYYYQVCMLLRSSVGPVKEEYIIERFENVISTVMNMVLIKLPSFNCPFKGLRAVTKTVLVNSVGYCLLVLLCLLYMVNKLLVRFGQKSNGSGDGRMALEHILDNRTAQTKELSFSKRVVSAFTHVSLLMYASSAHLCLSLLHCVPVDHEQVLFLDGNIKCYQTFQYFLIAYLISSILPFCLVPVFGSYLLKNGRISVKQFCAACIFPLPFSCFWLYLLLNDCRGRNQMTYNTVEDNDPEDNSREGESVILVAISDPFRIHQSFMCFSPANIPWEGFLIFRRLVLIILLTFIYDLQLKLFLALTSCVAILILHVFVNPFKRKRDNVLETFSLGAHILLCGSTLIKTLFYGKDISYSKCLSLLSTFESVLVVAPFSLIAVVVVLSIAIKLLVGLKICTLFIIEKVRSIFQHCWCST